jgi:hypothetical protein
MKCLGYCDLKRYLCLVKSGQNYAKISSGIFTAEADAASLKHFWNERGALLAAPE